ncbi:MAG: HD domain-containing protein, partial [Ruminococcus sp.]|nr:HD domain-containing protein [Ruminococcus sp.]
FGFDIEPQTSESVLKNRFLLNNIAVERLQTELLGILTGEYAEKLLNEYRDVIAVLIPEISECFDFEQRNIHHCFDVYRHIARSVGEIAAEPLLRVAMLMHDIGKPRVMTQDKNGTRHFKGHQQVSADIAEGVLRRLRFPKAFTDDCLKLIMYHDVRFNGSKKQVKRVMSQVGAELMPKLFQVMEADLLAQSDYLREEKKSSVETAKKRFEEIIAQNDCFSLKELKINGNDLKTIGISEGRQIGSVLSVLLDEVIDEQIENKKSALLKRAQQIIN